MVKRLMQVILFPLLVFIWVAPVTTICMAFGLIVFPVKFILTGKFEEEEIDKIMDFIFYPFEKIENI
ncbi:MAG TPA: hypothetical protein VIJ57_04960 [Hanamia sp.]